MPISAPVKLAFSITKLLRSAIQVAKAMVIATVITINKFLGVCQGFVVKRYSPDYCLIRLFNTLAYPSLSF